MKRTIFIVPMIIIIAGVITQSAITYVRYQHKYTNSMLESANSILKSVTSDLEMLHAKGLPYDQMQGVAEYLASKVNEAPILWSMKVSSTMYDTNDILHRESNMIIQVPLGQNDGQEDILIEMEISQQYLNQKLKMLLLVFLATMLVVIIVVWEMMRLPEQLLFKKTSLFNQSQNEQYEVLTGNIRSINFLMYTAVYVSMPYSAVLIRNWGIGIGKMSADIVASMPIVIELFSLMLFSLVFASKLKNLDLKVGTIIFGGLIIIGNMCCAYATHPIVVILSRMICSAGLAGMKHLINSIITLGSDTKERTSMHIMQMNAGVLGGIMCGGSLGGIIADSIGVNNTFIFSMIAAFLVIAAAVYMLPWKLLSQNKALEKQKTTEHQEVSPEISSENSKTPRKGMILNPEVIGYMIFAALPLYFGLMFLVAFIPSFVQKRDLPIILISYAYLINGMLGTYAGPVIGKLLNEKISKAGTIVITLSLGAVSMFIMKLPFSILMVLTASGLMGLFDGFGTPEIMNYFIDLDVVKKKIGSASALAILGVFGNAVGMMSPMVYTWAIDGHVFKMEGIVSLGVVYVICCLAFLMSSRKKVSQRQ